MRRHGTVTEHTLKDILDAFNRHDTDGVMSFFADDCALDMPRGAAPWGTGLIGLEDSRVRRSPALWSEPWVGRSLTLCLPSATRHPLSNNLRRTLAPERSRTNIIP
jgi:hypothetical protein